MAKFKINDCFNERLKTYINSHSFTSEVNKFGLQDTVTVPQGKTWTNNNWMPFIYVMKPKTPFKINNIKETLGSNIIDVNTGESNYAFYTPEYYHINESGLCDLLIIAQFSKLSNFESSSKIVSGCWTGVEQDVMLIPYSTLGISTREVLIRMLNKLGTVTNKRTLVIGSYALSKLTNEDKKIATDKGWTLA